MSVWLVLFTVTYYILNVRQLMYRESVNLFVWVYDPSVCIYYAPGAPSKSTFRNLEEVFFYSQ